MNLDPAKLVEVILWLLAGAIAFRFSMGNARILTTISVGFFLLFVSRAYLIAPAASIGVAALHSIVGTVAILALTHGFQEYYVFSRTLEVQGSKGAVVAVVATVVAFSGLVLLI